MSDKVYSFQDLVKFMPGVSISILKKWCEYLELGGRVGQGRSRPLGRKEAFKLWAFYKLRTDEMPVPWIIKTLQAYPMDTEFHKDYCRYLINLRKLEETFNHAFMEE